MFWEKEIKTIDEGQQIIGEVLCSERENGWYDTHPAHTAGNPDRCYWRKFSKDGYRPDKNHDGYLCINLRYHKPEFVIFYNDIFNSMRDKAEKKLYKLKKEG